MNKTSFYEVFCASVFCNSDIARIYEDKTISLVASKVRKVDIISKEKIFCSCKNCGTRNEIYVENGKYKSKIAKKML